MKKFFEYFYFLSKLSTSLILFTILIFFGYLFYNSYDKIDQNKSAYNDEFLKLFNLIENNQSEIKKLTNELNSKILQIDELYKKLEFVNFSKNASNLKKIDKEIINLKKSINEINLKQSNKYNNNEIYLLDIKRIIFIKFLNNINIDDELSLLDSKVDENSIHYIDKIRMLKRQIYFNFDDVTKEFKVLTNDYLIENFFHNKENYLIKFLSPIINVSPSNNKLYKNKDVKLLKEAKESLLIKDFETCILKLENLKFTSKNLENFKKKIKIYFDFEKNLNNLI